MDISRKLGIMVFTGVPAIMGGGIVYAMFGTFTAMWIYEFILYMVAVGIISK